jgi:hypothetical protein
MNIGLISNSPKIIFLQIKIFLINYIQVFKNICRKIIFGEFEIRPMKNILIKNKKKYIFKHI